MWSSDTSRRLQPDQGFQNSPPRTQAVVKSLRYAYFKAGDAAEELQSIGPTPGLIPEGGPMLYVTSFLHFTQGHETLLHSFGERNAETISGKTRARTHPYHAISTRLALLSKAFILLKILISLVRFQPDVLICPLMGSPLWTSAIAAKLSGAALVHSRHSIVPLKTGLWSCISRYLDRLAIGIATACLCHGRFLAKQLIAENVSPNRIFTFEPGFRGFRDSANTDSPLLLPKNSRYFLYAGRLLANKGALDLCLAALPVLAETKDLLLVYAGDGPAEKTIRDCAKQAGLTNRVVLLGHVAHKALAPLVKNSLFVVTPTQLYCPEGRCKTAAEAHVLGRPVVAPDFGPFPHYLTHEVDALLYEPDNMDKLGQAIRTLVTSPELLQRLSHGATTTGEKILDPQTSFLQALKKAFALAGKLPNKNADRQD